MIVPVFRKYTKLYWLSDGSEKSFLVFSTIEKRLNMLSWSGLNAASNVENIVKHVIEPTNILKPSNVKI